MIQSLVDMVFARIHVEDGAPYSEEICEHPNSQEFFDENQRQYLRRSRGIGDSPRDSIGLSDSYRKLAKNRVRRVRFEAGHQIERFGESRQKGGRGGGVQRPDENDCHELSIGLRGYL